MIMNASQPRVLIIDDDIGPRESLRILLKNEFEVFTAESVNRGLDFLSEKQPDAVVMDIRMPGLSGIEGLREIRRRDTSVAVIMLTGFGALETAQEAIRLGANDYLKKPFDTREMLETIRRNVQRAGINRQRRQAEQDLAELNQRLTAEMAAKDHMASLGQASAELVHDLRNPLTVILGYVRILSGELEKSKKTWGGDVEGAMDYIDAISNSVQRCRDLIESWLSIARRNPRPTTPIKIGPMVEEIAGNMARLLRDKGVKLETNIRDAETCVAGDELQISRVVQNLLSNAVDAVSPSDGALEVSCGRAGDRLRLVVRDNGRGIPAELMEKVFDPYFTTKPQHRGTGLGLFITRKIVEDHGGSIRIESGAGEGTAVFVELPICENVPA